MIDLGAIEVGGSVMAARFKLRNEGTGPVRILGAQPSCSCLDVGIERSALEPGDTADCVVKVAPGKSIGPRTSVVLVSTDDPAEPHFRLEVGWRLVGALSVRPQTLALGEIDAGKEVRRKVALRLAPSLHDADITVRAVRGNIPEVNYIVRPAEYGVAADRELEVSLRPRPNFEDCTHLLEVTATSPEGEAITARVAVTWRGVSAVQASPATFVLSDMVVSKPTRRRLTLDARDFTVLGVESSDGIAVAEQGRTESGQSFEVTVVPSVVGPFEGEVIFRTANADPVRVTVVGFASDVAKASTEAGPVDAE